MKHKIKVVMLPTEDRTFVVINNHLATKANVEYRPDLVKESTITKSPITFQHVYITIPQNIEPIKKGDWYIDNINTVRKSNNNQEYYWGVRKDYVKIIATTDASIMIDQVKPYNMKQCYSKQIPQLQQSFLEEFVANPDGEWEVEYSTFPIGPNGNVIGTNSDYPYNGLISNFTIKYKHKLSQNNTIFINAVKKKMYSKAEVESILVQYAEDEHGWFSSRSEIKAFNKWIKENL